ncbi:MAG: carbonic anhydrase [Verrucomicrobia bacterium]|nr:carbonic anhydrase [Verrucomicrobiota bacterium]
MIPCLKRPSRLSLFMKRPVWIFRGAAYLITLGLSHAGVPAEKARSILEAGNQRFTEGKALAHNWQKGQVAKTGAIGQTPSVAVLTCADSRTPPEVIFDMGVGDLFVCRNAGGFDTPEVNATFEYGVAVLGVHTILVLGHTKCGAVTATLEGKPVPGNISLLTKSLRPGIEKIHQEHADLSQEAQLSHAVEALVRYQMNVLIQNSELLHKSKMDGKLQVIGAVYDVETGRVHFLD